MTVVHITAGANTDTTAVVAGQVSGVASVRVAVDADPGMSAPAFYGPVIPSFTGMVRVQLANLAPSTRYFYQLETDSVLDGPVGQVRTCPPVGAGNSDFLIVAAGDGGRTPNTPGVSGTQVPLRMTNDPVHSLVADMHDPLQFIHLGDEGYYNLGSGEVWEDEFGNPVVFGFDIDAYRAQYADVFRQPNLAYLARRAARVHFWDDHEFGPNDSDRTAPGRDNATTAYREWEPHYPLADSVAIHQWWQIDRIGFMGWDQRADRDPNSDPQTSSKTMIGQFGRQWTEERLANARDEGTEFLLIVSPQVWLGLGADSWGLYTHERDLIVQMLGDYGWLGRCAMINADTHQLFMEDGSNNPYGSFPIWGFAPLDASPSNPPAWDYSLGFRTGQQSGQYGTLRFRDTGSTIEVIGTGWVYESTWKTLQFSVEATPPPPSSPGEEPEPPPAPTPGVIRNRVEWYGADLVTGRVISTIPDLSGRVSRVIGNYTTAGMTLPIPIAGPASMPIELAEQLTEPGRAMIVAVVNDIPTWAGIVGEQVGGTRATMDVPVASLESYLHRRFVRDHAWTNVDESVIVAGLLADAGDIPIPGLGTVGGIGLVLDAPPTGTSRDREYRASDHKTVYEALQELMDVQGGPEWTIDVDWSDETRTTFSKIFRLRSRIGTAAEAQSPAVFRAHSVYGTRTGAEARYELSRSYLDGDGATYVVAYSSGEGDDQPTSAPAIATDRIAAGFPIYEHVFQPSSSIISQDVLDAHAQAALDRMAAGSTVIKLTARWDAYPRYGLDWRLGDDIAWDLIGHRNPAGLTGQGRAIGFTLDMQAHVIEPILKDMS